MNLIHSFIYWIYILRIRRHFDQKLTDQLLAEFDRYINLTDRMEEAAAVDVYTETVQRIKAIIAPEELTEKCHKVVKFLPFELSICESMMHLSAALNTDFKHFHNSVGEIAYALHHIYD